MDLVRTFFDIYPSLRPEASKAAELDAAEISSNRGLIAVTQDVELPRFQESLEREMTTAARMIINNLVAAYKCSYEQARSIVLDERTEYGQALLKIATAISYEYQSIVNFQISGRKTFHFKNDLVDRLIATELNVKADLIRLPFPCSMFVYTSSEVVDALNALAQNPKTEPDYKTPVCIFTSEHPSENDLPGRTLLIQAFHIKSKTECHAIYRRSIYLQDDWSIEQSLRTDWAKIVGHKSPEEQSIFAIDDEKFYTDGLLLFRIVLNSILYLSSSEPDIRTLRSPRREMERLATEGKPIKVPKRIREEAAKYTALDYIEVGGLVPPLTVPENLRDQDRKIAVRFMVRGHWRNQAHGSGRLERKFIYIEPHYRGPDMAQEVLNKPYVVGMRM